MPDVLSKSQKKREADMLQDLGNQLCTLSDAHLQRLPLTDGLYSRITEAKRLKTHGAMRRQSQLIGKLIRGADHAAISQAFAELQANENGQSASFHAAEVWREKLLGGGQAALTEFLHTIAVPDIQHLRQLIKKATSTPSTIPQKTACKTLFRYIKSHL